MATDLTRIGWCLFNKKGLCAWGGLQTLDPATWADKDGAMALHGYNETWPLEAPFIYEPVWRLQDSPCPKDIEGHAGTMPEGEKFARCQSQCVHPLACSGLDKCVRAAANLSEGHRGQDGEGNAGTLLHAQVLQELDSIKDRCQRHGFFGVAPNYMDMRDIEGMADKAVQAMLQVVDAAGMKERDCEGKGVPPTGAGEQG